MVTTKQHYDEDPGPSGLGANLYIDDNVSGAASAKETKCPECERTFPTERSLGMHRHHQHPQEVNTERIAMKAGRRKIWTDDEDSLLIRLANQTWQANMQKMALYDHLQGAHPLRTAEAIKRRMRTLGWQPEATAPDPRPKTVDSIPQPLQLIDNPADPHTPIPVAAGRRWTKLEEAQLRIKADSIWRYGMTKKELATRTSSHMTHRSADAILKRLAAMKWTPSTSASTPKRPSAGPPTSTPDRERTPYPAMTTSTPPNQPYSQPQTPTPATTTTPETSPPTQDPYNIWRRRMMETILTDMKEPPLLAQALRETARAIMENKITTEDGARAVEEQVAMTFPATQRNAT